jgi:hypothetical protein
LAQAAPLFCHAPLVLQDCGCWPLHCAAPGVHDPVHIPLTHAWFVQATGVPQLPEVLHVCTPLPEHCNEPGAHDPAQTPDTQACPPQVTAVPH